MNNLRALDRSRVEGLLIRSITLIDYKRLSNEELLKSAWEKIQYVNIYDSYRYGLCRTAFELLLNAIEENRLSTLGLPRTKQEVLNYLETKKPNIRPNNQVNLELSSQLGQVEEINSLVYPNQPFNFQSLRAEIKRLKIQDLTSQIPLKKQELEQLINTAKERITRAESYILNQLLQKHSRILQANDNSDAEGLNELKEILNEKLIQEELQTLLNKQNEIFTLEKHLENLRTE
ncbi:3639_t:CDS:1 [Dentiscutata heterogama]|uniref:3639_t:CDS:1 n=1 Tax=Dentiscutata heterogama TaxID=1316150 RepID=A0ACA9N3B3_9GLOM|nr:3639_t:CDS:1 [Dentiscutata heterogama]